MADQTQAIADALAPFSDRLKPEAPDQLARIWADDFPNLSAAVVKDLVAQRLQSGNYNTFMQAAPVASAESRQVESLKASVAARGGFTNPLAGATRQ